jgi:hypothetical protein
VDGGRSSTSGALIAKRKRRNTMNIGTKVTHKFNGEMVGEVVAIGTGPFAGKAKVQIEVYLGSGDNDESQR